MDIFNDAKQSTQAVPLFDLQMGVGVFCVSRRARQVFA
jgi:hypothetical protein